jgi:hypothetical protein
MAEFDRCTGLSTDDACTEDQQIVYMVDGDAETILALTGFDIEAYEIF